MIRKKFGKFGMIVILCLTLFVFIACSHSSDDDSNEPDVVIGNELSAVNASSIKITETDSAFIAAWDEVQGAQRYSVTAAGKTYTVTGRVINFCMYSDFVFPTSDEITISIVAQADNMKDAEAAVKTYKTEGIVLSEPVVSIEDGIAEWQAVPGAVAYILKVNGSVVSDNNDELYHGTSYSLNDDQAANTTVTISVTAVGDGVWRKNSSAASIVFNPSSGSVTIAPIEEYTIENELISWTAINGVTRYRVVDLDYNIVIVEGTSYDMSIKNLVYGVYPIPADANAPSLDIVPVAIDYLEGNGTADDPYLIKTPFDLRAIDYYEMRYVEQGGERNYYRLENDIDYNQVIALEDESNIYTLRKPFFGVLDGNGKKLSNVKVNYDGGYWALFDFIATGATVKDITFDKIEITNKLQDDKHPLNASIAAVAHINNGTVSGITLRDATFSAQAGEVSGIVSRNYGTVSGCSVSGSFTQLSTSTIGAAAYEMAGVVLENLNGGVVENNTVVTLTIRGTSANIRSAAGVVSINRAGGTVRNNSFQSVAITGMAASSEYGGVVAYSNGIVTKGTGTLGTFTVGGVSVTAENGGADYRGKLVGKSER